MILVEACVDSIESAESAEEAGVDRLELCASLVEGGITPSHGLIRCCVADGGLPVHVMVRPRGGDFVYSEWEMAVMFADVTAAKSLGAAGIVAGILDGGGRIDRDRTSSLLERAYPLGVTFHRAFDTARDLDEALDDLIAIGVERVLTSGGAATAMEGMAALTSLNSRAAGRIRVMAGGGIRDHNVVRIIEATGIREVHARCAAIHEGARGHGARIRFRGSPLAEHAVEVLDVEKMSRLVGAVR